MRFAKSLRLSVSCWPVMLKGLFAQLLIIALVVAVAFLLFGPLVSDIVALADQLQLGELVSDTVISIADGSFNASEFSEVLETKLAEIKAGIEAIPNMWNRVEVSYVILIIIVCVYRMMVSGADVAVACQLEEFMTSNASRPFTWFFFKKSGKSFKFVLMQFIISFPLDLIVAFSTIGFYLLFLITFRWWTIFPAVAIALVMYAVRQTVFAFWLPSIASEETSVSASLTNGLSKIPGDFFRVFFKTFLIILVMEAVSICLTVFLKDKVLGVAISAVVNLLGFFLIKCVNMVEYFETCGKAYFYKRVDIEGTEYYNKKHRKA